MSYEDLLKNTVLLLKRHPEFKRPAWIIIDEIQDCDERQLEMIQELKGPETRIFAVGDPNQVIYSWRGSVLVSVFLSSESALSGERTLFTRRIIVLPERF